MPRRCTRPALGFVLLLVVACAQTPRPTVPGPLPPERMAELWMEPANIRARNLFHGFGGSRYAPRKDVPYRFKKRDTTGRSPGYDVVDRQGREWSVKLGEEAQPEVVLSRIHWAVGYHQPPNHFLREWTLEGASPKEDGEQPPGRFRPEIRGMKKVSDWSWQRNPFVGTRPFKGLIVLNVLLQNGDFKESNAKVYELDRPREGARRWYVFRDLGAALGRVRLLQHDVKNDIEAYERTEFIDEVEDGEVEFGYGGRHRELLDGITPEDVTWICGLLSRLTDRQWDDAFRAAGYTPEIRARYIRKIKANIREGLSLRARGAEGEPRHD
jgi:hypothetical protein